MQNKKKKTLVIIFLESENFQSLDYFFGYIHKYIFGDIYIYILKAFSSC